MNDLAPSRVPAGLSSDKPISLAIVAMGGQGGGVLADWIVATAEASGWHAQSTSVPGVAQRTGATIYYLELLSGSAGICPVLSLMPTPGDVDVVIAAELMEAGRSMLRGLVTPEKTVLITSTHRALAISEKSTSGDGAADPNMVTMAAGVAARRVIAFDMQQMAANAGSMISASLFGALAGAAVLPFSRSAFEGAINAGGKGVEPSLRAFAAGFEAATLQGKPAPIKRAIAKRFEALATGSPHAVLNALVDRIRTGFPSALQPMLMVGVRRLVDYQDPAYACEYLDRVASFVVAGRMSPASAAAAKYIAVAMAYDDVIRVADLKTRASRFSRVRAEMGVSDAQLMGTTEFMHPRGEEVVGLLPAALGAFITRRPTLLRGIDRLVNHPRRVRTGTILWFLTLYAISGLRRVRRGTYRHRAEMRHIDAWLQLARCILPTNERLVTEILTTRRLVKGYSDTHARGASKFDRVLSAVAAVQHRDDGADWLRRLREAAMADEHGVALDGALRTVQSLDHV